MRRWNQSGQKYAGASDIASFFTAEHKNLLWLLVTATYMQTGLQIYARGAVYFTGSRKTAFYYFVVMQVIVAFAFKALFTLNDDPDLVPDLVMRLLAAYQVFTLTALARLIFGMALVSIVLVVLSRRNISQPQTNSTLR